MEFLETLNALAAKIGQKAAAIQTEEATKNAFVMPLIHTTSLILPNSRRSTCATLAPKKAKKIDYAIFNNGEVQILVECKKIGEPLNLNRARLATFNVMRKGDV